jgi:transcriptional regulator with XRE-family HTH domain
MPPSPDRDLQAVFLERFSAARKRQGRHVTQHDIAAVLGVSQQTVAKMENGQQRLRLNEVEKLAQVVGVPLAELLGFGPSESTESLLARLDDERTRRDLASGAIALSDEKLAEFQAQLSEVQADIDTWRRGKWFMTNDRSMAEANIASLERELAERGELPPEGVDDGEHQEEA